MISNNKAMTTGDMLLLNDCGQVPPTKAFKRSLESEIDITEPRSLRGFIFPEDRTGVRHTSIDARQGVSITENKLRLPKPAVPNSVFALKLDSKVPVTSLNLNIPTIVRVDEDPQCSIAVKTTEDIGYLIGSTQTRADRNQTHEDKMSRSAVVGSWNSSHGLNRTSQNCSASIMSSCTWNSYFGIGDELSQALTPTFKHTHEEDLFDNKSNLCPMQQTPEKLYGSPEQKEVDIVPNCVSSFAKESWYRKSEPLLEAVVASASSSHQSALTIADGIFSRTLSGESESITLKTIAQDPISFNTSGNGTTTNSVSVKSDSKASERLPKVTRKRTRSGESMRPRPRDRQQIQDRLCELRELIPNGSKCSIDSLLQKTIGHMLFLQNVAQHNDNLKKNVQSQNDMESGATWAFELHGDGDGDETGHPILVKNLNQPHQLLVEMHCKQRHHFLEIAEEIRNLGLSILKGVMESRSDKLWARFIVEANRDVHRIDIMMSLMHLLHTNDDCSASLAMDNKK